MSSYGNPLISKDFLDESPVLLLYSRFPKMPSRRSILAWALAMAVLSGHGVWGEEPGEAAGEFAVPAVSPSPISSEEPDYSLVPSLKVDLSASSSFISDSNTTQSPNGPSASLFAFAYGADVRSGNEKARGGFYGFNYVGQAYLYLDSADQFGRDPYEHFFGGRIGANGGFTSVRLDVDYHRNNGNALQWDRVQRETRRAASHDYGYDFDLVRKLSRGTVELGAGYTLRDFDQGTGFGDGESSYGDLAWMTTPAFAPRSDLGLGVRFGSDDYDGNLDQDYVTPSLRWRYRLSGKTSLHNTLGHEFRSVDAAGGRDSEHFVYNGGVDWAATARTGFGLAYYRRVQPSYVLNGEDVVTSGATVQMRNQLPKNFLLKTQVGWENADYFAATGAPASGREDDFLRLSIELSRPILLTDRLRGEWGVFYQHNRNDSTLAPVEFDQNIIGLRVGLIY